MSDLFDEYDWQYEDIPLPSQRKVTRLVRRKTPSVVLVKREFLPRLRDWWTSRRLYHLLGLDK